MSYKVQLLHVHTDFIGANLGIDVLFPLSWTESSDCYNKSLSHLVKYITEQFLVTFIPLSYTHILH